MVDTLISIRQRPIHMHVVLELSCVWSRLYLTCLVSAHLLVAHLDLYLHLHDGGYDGEDRVVGATRAYLPRLEGHVDVGVLNQCQAAKPRRAE